MRELPHIWGCTKKSHSCGSPSSSSTNQDQWSANHPLQGHNGATRTNESLVESRTLDNTCLSIANRGKAKADRRSLGCWNLSLTRQRVQNLRHVQRKLGIGVGDKQDEMRMTVHSANLLKHPQKKGTILWEESGRDN